MPSPSGASTTTEPVSLPRDSAVLGPFVHPGEMLLEEFLRPLGLQQSIVADELGISRNRLNELVMGKRSVTADTAIRLERRFNMPARFLVAPPGRLRPADGAERSRGSRSSYEAARVAGALLGQD